MSSKGNEQKAVQDAVSLISSFDGFLSEYEVVYRLNKLRGVNPKTARKVVNLLIDAGIIEKKNVDRERYVDKFFSGSTYEDDIISFKKDFHSVRTVLRVNYVSILNPAWQKIPKDELKMRFWDWSTLLEETKKAVFYAMKLADYTARYTTVDLILESFQAERESMILDHLKKYKEYKSNLST